MQISSAINKLQQRYWKVQKKNEADYIASKGDKNIRMRIEYSYSTGSYTGEIESIYVDSSTLRSTKVYNVTNALKTLGEIESKPRSVTTAKSAVSYGSSSKTKEEIVRSFWLTSDRSSFSKDDIWSLQITSEEEIASIFDSAFSKELAPRKRSNYRHDEMVRKIRKAQSELWKYAIREFQVRCPETPMLRKVTVTTNIPDYEDLQTNNYYYNSYEKPQIKGTTHVFAFTENEAVGIVKAIMGDFAEVSDNGVIMIGEPKKILPKVQALNNDCSPVKEELINLDRAKLNHANRLKEYEKALRFKELSEKKVEFATFLENLTSTAFAGSTSGILQEEEI